MVHPNMETFSVTNYDMVILQAIREGTLFNMYLYAGGVMLKAFLDYILITVDS